MTADWFRQTEWSEKHLAEFLARNRRSRGSHSKSQHILLQAGALLGTSSPPLAEAGLDLLVNHYFPEYSRETLASAAFCCAGRCCEALGRVDEAIAYYERALERESEMPNVESGAAYLLAKMAVELGRGHLVKRALLGIDPEKASLFPWHSYIVAGACAFLAAQEGDPASARTHAKAALDRAAVLDNGLGWGRGALGTVRETETRFHKTVTVLAGA
jgi:hypothetical protein